jgi:hypothetical protein
MRTTTKHIKAKPDSTSKRAAPKPKRVRITRAGGPIRPLSDYDLFALHKAGQREWKGDAKDFTTWTPCRVCGGPAGTSAEYVAPFRRHRACRSLSSPQSRIRVAAKELLGVDLSKVDARLVTNAVEVLAYVDTAGAQPVPVGGRLPRAWGHLDRRAIKKAISNLPTLRQEAGVDPTPCTDGPCAWCGVREATGWADHGHRWADSSKAPLCGRCSDLYTTYSRSPVEIVIVGDYSTQRRLAWCALTGSVPRAGYSAPKGYRIFAEVAPSDHPGHEESGGYIAAEQRPGTPECAERIEREYAEALAIAEASRATATEVKQREAELWGFSNGVGGE